MKFIKIIGSILHPVEKKLKLLKIDSVTKINITGINKELKEGQLYLYIDGVGLDKKVLYDWNIKFDNDNIITPTSIGPVLILSKNNTLKYILSTESKVTITTENYISLEFNI